MDREEILRVLRDNEALLRRRGVAHAALFGSRARGDNRVDSDTDIMIDLDPAVRITVFDYSAVKDQIGDILGGRVDVVNRKALKPWIAPAALSDAVYAF